MIVLTKFETDVKIYINCKIYLIQVFKQSIIHYTSKPQYSIFICNTYNILKMAVIYGAY